MPKVKIETVVSNVPVKAGVDAARKVLYTGKVGDGKIFVYAIDDVIRESTGENGTDALQYDGKYVLAIDILNKKLLPVFFNTGSALRSFMILYFIGSQLIAAVI